MKGLWDEMRPKAEEVRNSTKTQIRSLLTPEQQKKFDVLQERWRRNGAAGPTGAGLEESGSPFLLLGALPASSRGPLTWNNASAKPGRTTRPSGPPGRRCEARKRRPGRLESLRA